MKKYQRLYVKYLIKHPVLFYGYMVLFLTVFLGLSLSIKLDVIQSYPAVINGSVISVKQLDIKDMLGDKIYYYTDRNEKVYTAEAADIVIHDGILEIHVSESESIVTSEAITIDFVVGRQTLLERIFVKAGKSE